MDRKSDLNSFGGFGASGGFCSWFSLQFEQHGGTRVVLHCSRLAHLYILYPLAALLT